MPHKKLAYPLIVNMLLRCTRDDDKAAPIFEEIKEVPGLWVLEFGPYYHPQKWSTALSEAKKIMIRNEALLRKLSEDNKEFSLYIDVEVAEVSWPLLLPPSLSEILASCKITLEIRCSPISNDLLE